MKRILAATIMIFATTGLVVSSPVEAKRLGGGSSVGMKRAAPPPAQAPSATPQQAPAASSAAAPSNANTANRTQSGFSKWLGPLAALGIGAGLMSLFGGSALGAALGSMLTMLLIGGAIFFLFKMFRRKSQATPTHGMQYAGHPGLTPEPETPVKAYTPTSYSPSADVPDSPAALSDSPSALSRFPQGFDSEGFLRQAKISFLRLQAANDANDLSDIRDFTTPNLYAELAMQIQERQKIPQKTEVIDLNAELLDVAVEQQRTIASVRYSGQVREDVDGPTVPFSETWHVVKDLTRNPPTWHIAGIQQDDVVEIIKN